MRPLLLLANHVSWIDILAIAGTSGSAFVAHSGLAAFAPLRWLCGLNRTIFIDRTRRDGLATEPGKLRAALAHGGVLTLFPEGTTGDGTTLAAFKSSLLAALAPPPAALIAQPVWLDYGVEAADIAWVGAESGWANALRVLARAAPITLDLHFLDPLAPAECVSRKAMAAAARARIAAAMAGNAREGAQRVAL